MDENEAKKHAYIICYVQTAIDSRVLLYYLYYLWYGQKFAARSCNNWSLGGGGGVNSIDINSLPTNDGKCRHDLCELSISLWEFIWGFYFNTRRYTLVHGFCFFKLFLMVGKELILWGNSHSWECHCIMSTVWSMSTVIWVHGCVQFTLGNVIIILCCITVVVTIFLWKNFTRC